MSFVCVIAALSGDKSKLLLSAKKVRRATGMEFVVSLSGNDFSRSSTSYIGKLRYVYADDSVSSRLD